jgi:hypothetical protein
MENGRRELGDFPLASSVPAPDPRFRKFLRLPDPDPLVGGTDLNMDSTRFRILILPSSSKNSKKNLYFYCFLTLLLFIFEK